MGTKHKRKVKIGSRVRVMNIDRSKDLGLGTYLGVFFIPEFCSQSPRIYLDSKHEIYGYQCWWIEDVLAPAIRPFVLALPNKVRVLEGIGRYEMRLNGQSLEKNAVISIARLERKHFESKQHVVFVTPHRFFFIVTEVGLPKYEETAETTLA